MAIHSQLDGADFARKIERQVAEARQLNSRINHQTDSIASLQARVYGIENSVIFRFLRWLGPRLAWTGIPLFQDTREPGQKPASPGTHPREYAEWAQEQVLFRRALSQLRVRPEGSSGASRVSILVEAREIDQPGFERLIRSITEQDCWEWELLVSTKGEPPAWLEDFLATHVVGHRAEILAAEDLGRSLQLALDKCTGEFVAVLDSATILEPDALRQLVLAATHDVIAVYSDWDHVDASGRFHAPRFTPELSLDLLRRAAYWGQCYLVRTAWLRRANWPGDTAAPNPLHDLALRLAEAFQPIRRVPQVLWHAQSHALERPGPVQATAPPPGPGSGRVSVIVCSRNPDQLTRCLEAVLPTLGQRNELIVVAHGHGGKGPVLEQIAASHQLPCVRYDGPFHFGLMNHMGVAQSSGEVLCFLNDDVEPLTPDWLERMRAQAERPDIGVVGALLLFPNRTIQHAGVSIGGGCLPAHIGRSLTESFYWPWLRTTRDVTAVTGACALLRREVWEELGGFDLRFPVNYNDIDLCLRAIERGYRILIEADAVLLHDESTTREPVVLPEEIELFSELWGHLVSAPDRFFNSQLELGEKEIRLRTTLPTARLAGIGVGAPPPPSAARAARGPGAGQ